MSIKSTTLGKAYEYACLLALQKRVSPIRPLRIEQNSSLGIAKLRFSEISTNEQEEMLKSAAAGIDLILKMEPRITEDGNDTLTIFLQPDNIARTGDIRDVIIIRRSIEWEIGISVKHNHAALKHSRLSLRIDFGKEWFGTPCSQQYFDEIKPIFDNLATLKNQNELWANLPNKSVDVYLPLLRAFTKEFNSLFQKHKSNVTAGIIQYLLGSNGKDYYKMIHYNNHITRIVPFNVSGTLNMPSGTSAPEIDIPKIDLPTRIIEMVPKENSDTTVVLTMDNGWSISFRIHNASSRIEPSLKFDIQLQGMPTEMFYLDTKW